MKIPHQKYLCTAVILKKWNKTVGRHMSNKHKHCIKSTQNTTCAFTEREIPIYFIYMLIRDSGRSEAMCRTVLL